MGCINVMYNSPFANNTMKNNYIKIWFTVLLIIYGDVSDAVNINKKVVIGDIVKFLGVWRGSILLL